MPAIIRTRFQLPNPTGQFAANHVENLGRRSSRRFCKPPVVKSRVHTHPEVVDRVLLRILACGRWRRRGLRLHSRLCIAVWQRNELVCRGCPIYGAPLGHNDFFDGGKRTKRRWPLRGGVPSGIALNRSEPTRQKRAFRNFKTDLAGK